MLMSRLAFYVRQLLSDLAITNLEEVDPANVARHPVADPVIDPPDDAAISTSEDFFGFEFGGGRAREEGRPEAAHRGLAHEPLAVRNRTGAVEDTIVRHGGHDRIDVVAVEDLVELLDNHERRRGGGVGCGLAHRSSGSHDRMESET